MTGIFVLDEDVMGNGEYVCHAGESPRRRAPAWRNVPRSSKEAIVTSVLPNHWQLSGERCTSFSWRVLAYPVNDAYRMAHNSSVERFCGISVTCSCSSLNLSVRCPDIFRRSSLLRKECLLSASYQFDMNHRWVTDSQVAGEEEKKQWQELPSLYLVFAPNKRTDRTLIGKSPHCPTVQ